MKIHILLGFTCVNVRAPENAALVVSGGGAQVRNQQGIIVTDAAIKQENYANRRVCFADPPVSAIVEPVDEVDEVGERVLKRSTSFAELEELFDSNQCNEEDEEVAKSEDGKMGSEICKNASERSWFSSKWADCLRSLILKFERCFGGNNGNSDKEGALAEIDQDALERALSFVWERSLSPAPREQSPSLSPVPREQSSSLSSQERSPALSPVPQERSPALSPVPQERSLSLSPRERSPALSPVPLEQSQSFSEISSIARERSSSFYELDRFLRHNNGDFW